MTIWVQVTTLALVQKHYTTLALSLWAFFDLLAITLNTTPDRGKETTLLITKVQ